MNSENIKNNDPVQLQQMIIFLRAELAKYKYVVEKYKDGYHYSLVENLEQENVQLTNEKNALSGDLYELNQELEKRTSDYKELTHLYEIQREKYSTSIDNLQKTKTYLWPINKQLNEVIKRLKDGISANQDRNRKQERRILSLDKKVTDHKTTIEQVENKIVDFILEANTHVQSQLEKLEITNKERTQSEEMKQYLLREMERKDNTIGKLQQEISDLKEQCKRHNDVVSLLEQNIKQKNDDQEAIDSLQLTSTTTIDSETLMQLDHQIKEVLAKSMDYEGKLDAKLLEINNLERKLDQLTMEVDGIKVFSIEGLVSKGF